MSIKQYRQMKTTLFTAIVAIFAVQALVGGTEPARPKPAAPKPTHADISFGPNGHQLIDIYLPTQGEKPYPALLWFGGIWKAAKHPANLGFFQPRGIAVIAVQVRTMEDATAAGDKEPASFVQSDAIRAVQFVRHIAAKWNLDPTRLAIGGGSQGAQPALFGRLRTGLRQCRVERSSRARVVARQVRGRVSLPADIRSRADAAMGARREVGRPPLGCSFDESLIRRDELLPVIRKWSPDYLLHKDAAPMFFENEWGLTKPDDITQANYDVHSPAWALGFQKLALAAGAECYVKFPDHPADEAARDIWDFVARRLRP